MLGFLFFNGFLGHCVLKNTVKKSSKNRNKGISLKGKLQQINYKIEFLQEKAIHFGVIVLI